MIRWEGGPGDSFPGPSSFLPGEEQTHGGGGGGSPSLVGYCITQQKHVDSDKEKTCPDGRWSVGNCRHGTTRWVYIPCKRRTCPICGVKRRKRIAWRVAEGVDRLAPAAWFVGTFSYDIEKKQAVKVQAKFVRWVREYVGHKVEYAATWEETKRGRLHLNMVLAPWSFIPQKLLSEKWERFGGGKRVWIESVGSEVGNEVTKSKWQVANYFAKFEQMVLEGKAATYSKGWPQLLAAAQVKRKGEITWSSWGGTFDDETRVFLSELKLHYWREIREREYAFLFESCDCFDVVHPPGGDLH